MAGHSNPNRFSPRTKMVLAGRDTSDQFGFVNTPIYRGSTVLYPTLEELKTRRQRYVYGTRGTPTTEALEKAWSEISNAAGTVLVPSGLAAIVLALQSLLRAGDHMLVADTVYRPTRNLADTVLKRFGVETTYYDPTIGAGLAALMRPNTRVVFTEAPGSQTFEMQDIPAIAEIASKHGAFTVMDNTWATPLFFPAHDFGVDLVIEAGTKYLGGHSDLLMGLVSANSRAWPELKTTADSMAVCAGPEDCFLALRGLRTMRMRLEEAQRQGFAMADWMAARPEVKRVMHPGLPSDPGHVLWKRDFKGASGLFGAILHPVSEKQVAAFFDGLELFGMGYSWGGYESLCVPYDNVTMASLRTTTGWTETGVLIRLQIGFEDVADLQADLAAGFARMRAAA